MPSLKKVCFLVATLIALDIQQLGVTSSQEKRNAMTIIPDPVCVKRRDTRDIVYTGIECTTPHICPRSQPTYLVSDQACISNQNIVGMCGFKLVPAGKIEMAANSIGVLFENGHLSMYIQSTLHPAQVVYYNQTQVQQLHNCFIVSLEVYRGVDTFTRINHRGFTMGNNNIIQVDENLLAYNRTNYNGEVYRMSIRCSNDAMLSIDDCVIFKMLDSKVTSIWKAKFNCSVPGTNASETECQQASIKSFTETDNRPTMENDRNSNKATDTISNYATTEQEEKQVLYLIISTGGSIGVLALVVVALFFVLCFQCTRDTVSNTIPLQGVYQSEQPTHQLQLTPTNESVHAADQVVDSKGLVATTFQTGGYKPNPLYGYSNPEPSNPEEHIYDAVTKMQTSMEIYSEF